MTINSTEQIHEVAAIKEQYIHDGPFVFDDYDTCGWVQGTIRDFEIDEDDEDLDVVIDLPWGETHRYGYDLDGITSNKFADFCEAYHRSVSEFETITGEDIWLKVRYINIDDDGDIDSGTRMHYGKVHTGPRHMIKRAGQVAAIVATVAVILVIL